MYFSVNELLDMAASLALVVVLASAYGAIRRLFHGAHHGWPDVALGILFGLAAVVQMHRPVEPFEGLIVDMRSVPVVLAGAFLGWRGLAVCLICAVGTRLQLGGVGAHSGALAMFIAAGVGCTWKRATEHRPSRRVLSLAVLGLATSAHLAAAIVLPTNIMMYFLVNIGPALILLNLISVPIAAAFLEHERRRIMYEQALANASETQAETGLLLWEPFKREVGLAFASGGLTHPGGLLVVTVRNHSWLRSHWGETSLDTVLGALRLHLEELCPKVINTGVTPKGQFVAAMPPDDILRAEDIIREIEQSLREDGVLLDGKIRSSLRVESTTTRTTSALDLVLALKALEEAGLRKGLQGTPRMAAKSQQVASVSSQSPMPEITSFEAFQIDERTHDMLFDKANLLLGARAA